MHYRMDPLWNSLIIAGLEGGKPFLGSVNMIGVAFSDDHLATGTAVMSSAQDLIHCFERSQNVAQLGICHAVTSVVQ